MSVAKVSSSNTAFSNEGLSRQTSAIPSYSVRQIKLFGSSGRNSGFDPINKTGLLPRDGSTQSIDGAKTWVVGSSTTVAPTHRLGGRNLPAYNNGGNGKMRTSMTGPAFGSSSGAKSREQLTAKQKERAKAKEEAIMRRMLKRDGGKTLGAKYLVQNGKAPPEASRSSLSSVKFRNGDGYESASPSHDESADDESKKRKRVFDVAAIRKIGFDPAGRGMESLSAQNAKQSKVSPSPVISLVHRDPHGCAQHPT